MVVAAATTSAARAAGLSGRSPAIGRRPASVFILQLIEPNRSVDAVRRPGLQTGLGLPNRTRGIAQWRDVVTRKGATLSSALRRCRAGVLRQRGPKRRFGFHRKDEVHAALNAGGDVERCVAVRVLVVPDLGTRAVVGK